MVTEFPGIPNQTATNSTSNSFPTDLYRKQALQLILSKVSNVTYEHVYVLSKVVISNVFMCDLCLTLIMLLWENKRFQGNDQPNKFIYSKMSVVLNTVIHLK